MTPRIDSETEQRYLIIRALLLRREFPFCSKAVRESVFLRNTHSDPKPRVLPTEDFKASKMYFLSKKVGSDFAETPLHV